MDWHHRRVMAERSEEDWKKVLTPEQFQVLRKKGTERAFTGEFWDDHRSGTYTCAGCGTALFDSETKFESGSGWPSFFAPIADGRVHLEEDSSHGMRRVEAVCAKCGGHLGHLFPDGPAPTGQRFCINSASLAFEEK